MTTPELHVVTGAFGYSGQYIARRLLDAGHRVRTLTNSPQRANPFGDRVEARLFNFDRPDLLTESLRGAVVLYNTYWVRFNHGDFTFARAVENTRALFAAAKAAGVRRVVHVSITRPTEGSPLEYFSGKAKTERALIDLGPSYAILRPTVLFGKEDILINNIAWALRHFSVFLMFGDGQYRLRPIYVDDLAALAAREGGGTENVVLDAVGPETFTFHELVEMIGEAIGCRRPIVSTPAAIACRLGWLIGKLQGDVMITREEAGGLMAGLLYTDSPASGPTRLTDWVRRHADALGHRYASELARRHDRLTAYSEL